MAARIPVNPGRAALLALVVTSASCMKAVPEPVYTPIPAVPSSEIEQVVFLVGDAGVGTLETSPLLVRLAQDVERWSGTLAREEAVSVVFLGDNVYPEGIRPVGNPLRVQDSLRLHAQVAALAGPDARRHGSRGFFVAGNHDWGDMPGAAGVARLGNMDAMLERYRRSGVRVNLHPSPGASGPDVVDVGSRVRFAFLDTFWWLQAAHDDVLHDTVFFDVGEVLEGAGDRALVFASHHPYASGGPHGGPIPIWKGLGILWLLKKSGSLVQSLNSPIYRELQAGLGRLFREVRRPLIYAGGHDHSLQVIEEDDPERPQWSLVSGSGSKLTEVSGVDGMHLGLGRPGFMRLVFRSDGSVDLHVLAAPEVFLLCGDDEEDPSGCMREGPSRFEEVFARQLRVGHRTGPSG